MELPRQRSLAKIAFLTECLKVVQNRLPTQRNRVNVIGVQFNIQMCCRASATTDAPNRPRLGGTAEPALRVSSVVLRVGMIVQSLSKRYPSRLLIR